MRKFIVLACLLAVSSSFGAEESYPCLIEPDETVELGSPVIGIVKSMKVERGDDITRGQVIAELEGDVEERSVDLARAKAKDSAAIQSAIAAHEHAKRELQRANLMFKQKLVSRQFLDQAETESKIAASNLQQVKNQQAQAKKELRLALSRLARSKIKAPFDGIVTDRFVAVGQRIQNQPLIKIAKVNPLRVEVIAPAEQFNQFNLGDTLLVTPDVGGLTETEATVRIIDPVIDSASNSFRITLTLPNDNWAIPAGAKCSVRALTNASEKSELISAKAETTKR